MNQKQQAVTSSDVIAALRSKYSLPEYAFLVEVANATGWKARSADGVALNLYPSRGLELHGFEVKVSRQDLTRELKTPQKAEAIARFCDCWWLVLSSADIIKPGELPEGWGLQVMSDNGTLRVVKEAARRGHQPITRQFLASLIRASQQEAQRIAEVAHASSEAYKAGAKAGERTGERAVAECEHLKRQIALFENESGISITDWRIGNIAKIVKRYQASEDLKACSDAAIREVERTVARLNSVLSDLKEDNQ